MRKYENVLDKREQSSIFFTNEAKVFPNKTNVM